MGAEEVDTGLEVDVFVEVDEGASPELGVDVLVETSGGVEVPVDVAVDVLVLAGELVGGNTGPYAWVAVGVGRQIMNACGQFVGDGRMGGGVGVFVTTTRPNGC